MTVRLQSFVGAEPDHSRSWDMSFCGSSVDDRGREAIYFAESVSTAIFRIAYDAESLSLNVNGDQLQVDGLADLFHDRGAKSVCIEATTLGFAEMLLAVRASRDAGIERIRFVYAEPGEYAKADEEGSSRARQFGLSKKVVGYQAIPGAAVILEESERQHAVFFLGYEGERLDRAFEELNLVPETCGVVFGVPAYRPGWEMDAFANNARVIKDRKLGGGVDFCAANSPYATIQLLEEKMRLCRRPSQLIVAPIGTKPHGIGIAIFADLHRELGILFDHPTRREGRSRKVHRWHWHDYVMAEA